MGGRAMEEAPGKKKMANEITFRGEGLGWEGRHNEQHSDDED